MLLPALLLALPLFALSPQAQDPSYAQTRKQLHWTQVPGTPLNTRQHLLRRTRENGGWTDPHTGYRSHRAGDFDIDHRVPLWQIWKEFPRFRRLPLHRQLQIYNDPDNLQVLEKHHNRKEKGGKPLCWHAREIKNGRFRKEFQRKGQAYLRKLEQQIGPREKPGMCRWQGRKRPRAYLIQNAPRQGKTRKNP